MGLPLLSSSMPLLDACRRRSTSWRESCCAQLVTAICPPKVCAGELGTRGRLPHCTRCIRTEVDHGLCCRRSLQRGATGVLTLSTPGASQAPQSCKVQSKLPKLAGWPGSLGRGKEEGGGHESGGARVMSKAFSFSPSRDRSGVSARSAGCPRSHGWHC